MSSVIAAAAALLLPHAWLLAGRRGRGAGDVASRLAVSLQREGRRAAAPVGLPRGHERPASKVCLWCGSQHRPKYFNEGAYTVVTDCDSDLDIYRHVRVSGTTET
jgi:hypothetical protein